ncbi:MAG: hypothetical protein CMO01_08265 [Thalassobius sp.]|nr:hypothetical protein [Thalassovita sp.]
MIKVSNQNFIFYLFTFFFLYPIFSKSQNIDYNKIILPDEIDSMSLQEKIIQLAWKNNPQSEIINKQKEIAVYKYKQKKSDWLNQISVQSNLNEAVINPPDNLDNNIFYPRYNFSIRVPLGVIATQKYETKIARENVKIAEENIKLQKLQIRSIAIEQYQNFLMSRNVYNISQQLVEDEHSRHLVIEQSFKNGEITLEEYSKSLKSYNDELMKWYSVEANLKIAKAQLEMLIGIPIDEIN